MTSRDPALSASSSRYPVESLSTSPPTPSPQVLLLVEEDSSDVRVIRRAFEGESELTLIAVPSLAEARAVLRERDPAVIVAGQVLPDGRGHELIDPVGGRRVPVILLTSPTGPGTAIERLEHNATDHVAKTAAGLADLPRVVHHALLASKDPRLVEGVEPPLAGAESRIRAILDAIPDLILIHDRGGRILECEGGSETELGRRRTELIGRELPHVVVPLCASRLAETILAVSDDGKTRTALYETDLPGSRRVFDSKLVRYGQTNVLAILRDITERHQASAKLAKLSPREHDVLSLIVEGKTNKAIGVRLGIGIKTVETHRANIMKKLKARTVAELLRLAFDAERH